MKRLMMVATITLLAPGAFAAGGTWTGEISDSMCGASHKAAQHSGKMTDTECTEACVKAGAKYVFSSGGKVYTIANQDDKDLALNAHKTVRLTGDKQGTTITVSKIVAITQETPAKPSGLTVKAG
jgi:outer membrane lipoprotein-sorting protein